MTKLNESIRDNLKRYYGLSEYDIEILEEETPTTRKYMSVLRKISWYGRKDDEILWNEGYQKAIADIKKIRGEKQI